MGKEEAECIPDKVLGSPCCSLSAPPDVQQTTDNHQVQNKNLLPPSSSHPLPDSKAPSLCDFPISINNPLSPFQSLLNPIRARLSPTHPLSPPSVPIDAASSPPLHLCAPTVVFCLSPAALCSPVFQSLRPPPGQAHPWDSPHQNLHQTPPL